MLGPATRQVNEDDRVTWNANCQLAIDPHYTQDQLTGGSIAGHVSAKFKKQRAASRNAGNELQNPLQRRTMASAFFCVQKGFAISGD